MFFRCRASNLGSLDRHATQLRYHCATFALFRARVFSVQIISPKKQKSGHDLNSIGIVGNVRSPMSELVKIRTPFSSRDRYWKRGLKIHNKNPLIFAGTVFDLHKFQESDFTLDPKSPIFNAEFGEIMAARFSKLFQRAPRKSPWPSRAELCLWSQESKKCQWEFRSWI